MALGRVAPALAPLLNMVRRWLAELPLDLRSLALLRIVFGALLIVDLLVRLTDLQAHYTDDGCLARSDVVDWMWNPAFWSVHMVAGHWAWQLALFVVAFGAHAALMVGYRTRFAGILSWALLISLQTRSQMVLDGGDLYYRCLLFWLMFSRWGERWSVDSLRQTGVDSERAWGVPEFAYAVQLTLIYLFAFLHKSGAEWRVEGTAVGYSLQIEQLTTPLGTWLLGQEALLQPLSFGVLIFEGVVPLLFWLDGSGRMLAVVSLTLLHFGLSMFFHLGLFGPVAMVASWGLLPASFWDRVAIRWKGPGRLWQRLLLRWPLAGAPSRPVAFGWNLALGFLLVRVVQWNFVEWDRRHVVLFPHDLYALRLDQRWDMFSPRPLREDGYYVIVGETIKGDQVDVWRDRPRVDWSKPVPLAPDYPNARWRKLMMNLWDTRHSVWRLPMLHYLAQRWDGRHPDQKLRCVQMYFVVELSLPQLRTAPLEVRSIAYYSSERWLDDCEGAAYASLENAQEVLHALNPGGK